MKLTTQQELQLWEDVHTVLVSVPADMRSQNHSQYLSEVDSRIYETKQLLDYQTENIEVEYTDIN